MIIFPAFSINDNWSIALVLLQKQKKIFFKKRKVVFVDLDFSCVCFLCTRSEAIPKQSYWQMFDRYFYLSAFKEVQDLLFAIYIEGYMSAPLVYWLCNSISSQEFYLLKIQGDCNSIIYSILRIAILCNSCISFELVRFFLLHTTKKLPQKRNRWELLNILIQLANFWRKTVIFLKLYCCPLI